MNTNKNACSLRISRLCLITTRLHAPCTCGPQHHQGPIHIAIDNRACYCQSHCPNCPKTASKNKQNLRTNLRGSHLGLGWWRFNAPMGALA